VVAQVVTKHCRVALLYLGQRCGERSGSPNWERPTRGARPARPVNQRCAHGSSVATATRPEGGRRLQYLPVHVSVPVISARTHAQASSPASFTIRVNVVRPDVISLA
jgi:hypothetical protein